MKINYSELLKSYLEKNVKPDDEGFALLWQIEGMLKSREQIESDEKAKLEKQKTETIELFDSCLENAKTLLAKYSFGEMHGSSTMLSYTCKLAIAMAGQIRNIKMLDAINFMLDSPISRPPALHFEKRDEILDLTDISMPNIPESSLNIIDEADESIVDVLKFYDILFHLQKTDLDPLDIILIHDEMGYIKPLTRSDIRVVRYAIVDMPPHRVEIINEDMPGYEMTKKALIIG